MRVPVLLAAVVISLGWASTPAGPTSPTAEGNGPCKGAFVGKTRGRGGGPERGEAYGVGPVLIGKRLGVGEEGIDALEGAVLRQVQLVHTTLGRGARTDGTATFEAPSGGSQLYLDARAPPAGYAWKVRIWKASWGRMSFWLGCKEDLPRQTVTWIFTLLDGKGNRSNAIEVPVECTGQPTPGPPPRLDAVNLNAIDLPPGGRTAARATLDGGSPPVVIVGAAVGRGNGWTWRDERIWKESAFSVGCEGSAPHLVEWRFRVRDTYGRESNVVEKTLNCGGCR